MLNMSTKYLTVLFLILITELWLFSVLSSKAGKEVIMVHHTLTPVALCIKYLKIKSCKWDVNTNEMHHYIKPKSNLKISIC